MHFERNKYMSVSFGPEAWRPEQIQKSLQIDEHSDGRIARFYSLADKAYSTRLEKVGLDEAELKRLGQQQIEKFNMRRAAQNKLLH